MRYVEKFFNCMVAEKHIDVLVEKHEKKALKSGKDLQKLGINRIRNKDVREIDAEWLSFQALAQSEIASFLEHYVWDKQDIKLAQSHCFRR